MLIDFFMLCEMEGGIAKSIDKECANQCLKEGILPYESKIHYYPENRSSEGWSMSSDLAQLTIFGLRYAVLQYLNR